MGQRIVTAVLSGAICLVQMSTAVNADITAANVNYDRTTFIKCSNAIDVMSQSDDKFRNAVVACAASLRYYAQKADKQKTLDGICLYRLYTGSSAERYAYVLARSANRDGAKKASDYGDDILKGVIEHCTDEPNILRAAKGVLQGSAAFRQ